MKLFSQHYHEIWLPHSTFCNIAGSQSDYWCNPMKAFYIYNCMIMYENTVNS